jgi:small subunit ribosomal protein S1
VKGKVISLKKNKIVVDLNGVAVGIASGKDTHDSVRTIDNLKEGDEITAVVIGDENSDGMVVLSLRKASQAAAWDRFEEVYKSGAIIEVVINEANKGGLLLDIDGIKGFIPVSQLAPMHYPRVEGADSSQILTRLQKLISKKLLVKVINVDRATGKMILSEKAAIESDTVAALKQLQPGDVVRGKVSGVVKFGIFVTFNGLEGLVHISEIAWGHVSDPHQYAKVGDEVEVEVIGIEGEKLSLSMKRLTHDPWEEIAVKYPIGSTVKGKINRFSQFGAFVQLQDDINGLIHLSEIADTKVENPADFLEIGQEVQAQVINIDRDEHRIGLSLKALQGEGKKPKAKAKKKDEGEKESEEKSIEPAAEEKEPAELAAAKEEAAPSATEEKAKEEKPKAKKKKEVTEEKAEKEEKPKKAAAKKKKED